MYNGPDLLTMMRQMRGTGFNAFDDSLKEIRDNAGSGTSGNTTTMGKRIWKLYRKLVLGEKVGDN